MASSAAPPLAGPRRWYRWRRIAGFPAGLPRAALFRDTALPPPARQQRPGDPLQIQRPAREPAQLALRLRPISLILSGSGSIMTAWLDSFHVVAISVCSRV